MAKKRRSTPKRTTTKRMVDVTKHHAVRTPKRFSKEIDRIHRFQERIAKMHEGEITIKTVSFRGMLMIGQYQNLHLEASADVPEGRTARETLDHLKKFVATELKRAKDGQVVLPPSGTFHRSLAEVEEDIDDDYVERERW